MSTNGSSKQLISGKKHDHHKIHFCIFLWLLKKTTLKLSPVKQLISQGDLDVHSMCQSSVNGGKSVAQSRPFM